MNLLLIVLLIGQAAEPTEHDIGEEVITGEAEFKITDRKIVLAPELKPFAPLDSIISQERYIFDDKLYATIDSLNTPILYLHSEYLRIPLLSRLVYGEIALFIPRFEKTVSSWELIITDSNGEIVRRIAERGLPPASLSWDGRKNNGTMCNMGEVYNYVFTAFDAVGNPTRIGGRSYRFTGIVYEEHDNTIIAIASNELFRDNTQMSTEYAGYYYDEVANVIKDNFQEEVIVYSYSESESRAKAHGQAVMDEIVKRTVLPAEGIKTAPRFTIGLQPKFSKIEIVIR
ncbi:MAG: hypothetical protein JSW02_11025 [candidate division WOR-3 bacterium]|nr:MAG: hypothetical protein JSW02_11025 [candidate division WOR-3 bacterium]